MLVVDHIAVLVNVCLKASRLEIPLDSELSEADIKSQLLSRVDNCSQKLVSSRLSQCFVDFILFLFLNDKIIQHFR